MADLAATLRDNPGLRHAISGAGAVLADAPPDLATDAGVDA